MAALGYSPDFAQELRGVVCLLILLNLGAQGGGGVPDTPGCGPWRSWEVSAALLVLGLRQCLTFHRSLPHHSLHSHLWRSLWSDLSSFAPFPGRRRCCRRRWSRPWPRCLMCPPPPCTVSRCRPSPSPTTRAVPTASRNASTPLQVGTAAILPLQLHFYPFTGAHSSELRALAGQRASPPSPASWQGQESLNPTFAGVFCPWNCLSPPGNDSLVLKSEQINQIC